MAEVRGIVTRCLLGLVAIMTVHRSVKVYGVDSCSDPNVAYIASNVALKYEVIANSGSNVGCRVNLTNVGSGNVTTGNWEIYFSHTRLIISTSLSNSTGLRVDHVNGVLQKFVPLSNFGPLTSNSVLVVTFLASDWIVSRTDVMPNWYVVTRGCQDAQVISSTAGESLNFVSPFISSQQWKRTIPVDTYNPWTPDDRYAENYVKDMKGANSIVIPTPFSTNLHSTDTIDLRSGQWVVIIPDDASLQAEAKYISEYLHIDLIPASPNVPTKYSIGLNINPAAILTTLPLKNNEANYRLVVSGQTSPSITISGQGRAGVFYGIQTLLSLSDSGNGKIPTGSVDDGPRFDYRGMHIDVCRNFHTTDDLMRLLDAMATYKMNNLHLHLGDDEGWRLEIPEIPELIEIGSKRCHDVTGDQCIMPQLGSAPTLPNIGSGFYPVGEYRAILDYANKRHIRVIPEFDMPGHAHAAIHAMLARYRKYNSSGDSSRAKEYLLTDLNDNSDYTSIQGFTDNAINPCVNSTYDFIETVLRSMQNLHADIQPLTLYHIGGDEVSSTAWINSPACRNQFGPNLTQIMVKTYFVQGVSNITRAANVAQVIWEDGIYSGNSPFTFDINVNNDTYCNTWDNVWGWGTEGRAYTLANAGYKVILSHATHLYFDFPSEPDPEERGYYWATRTTSMKKAYSYLPDDFYGNMDLDVDRMGSPLNRTAICITDGCPALTRPENIVGMQGHMWSETIRTSSEVDYMIFPRLLALAERAWHKAAWESESNLAAKKSKLDADWEQFANAVGYNELKRLDRMGVKYRLAPPGVRVDNSTGKVYVTSGLPGSDSVYYRKTSGDEWTVVPDGNQLTLDSTVREVQFSVWSSDKRRSSRSVVVPLDIHSNDINAAPSTSVSIFILLFPWILINSMF